MAEKQISPEGKAFRAFAENPTPKNLAAYLNYWDGGFVVKVQLLTEDGAQMKLDASTGDKIKAFKKGLKEKGFTVAELLITLAVIAIFWWYFR